MALHRDIFWVGRQWAVTGYGIQACDQKQKSKFDIDATRLWDDGVLKSMRDLAWLNIADFEQAIVVARKYHPEPAQKATPPEEHVLGLIAELLSEPSHVDAAPKETAPTKTAKKAAVEPGPALKFELRVEGWPAKFVPNWRVRIRR
jgi:hypothetical protein